MYIIYRGHWLILCSFMFFYGGVSAASNVDTLFDKQFKKRQMLAQAGHQQEQYKLGLAYLRGNQVKVDINKAVYWFKKAALQRHVKAIYRLGMIYHSSRYGKKNSRQAFRFLSQAAKRNYGPSQYQLAIMYFEGQGVKRNSSDANHWAARARKNNVSGATALIARINKSNRANNARKLHRTDSVGKFSAPQKRNKAVFKNAAETRNKILNGIWKLRGEQAQYLPSGINSCTKVQQQITCLSTQIMTETDSFKGVYRVRSTLSDFYKKGEFRVQYRLNYVQVAPIVTESGDEDPDEDTDDETPKLGWQPTTTKLKCYVINQNSLKCHTNDFAIERYSRQGTQNRKYR